MKAGIVLSLVLAACGVSTRPLEPDAGLPSCPSVGCDHLAFCSKEGVCHCPQPDGGSVECRFYPADAGVP
jgi:hypothetical protein